MSKIHTTQNIFKAPGSFHGGIHPQEFKTLSNQRAIKKVSISPELLVLPLKQHIGQTCKPVVSISDCVSKGQTIAISPDKINRIHSPVNGKVISIGLAPTGHPSGKPLEVIVIEPGQTIEPIDTVVSNLDGQFLNKIEDWKHASKEQLLEQIKSAGIVGLGGATFPTARKLQAQKISTLIVNAMECEPYITCDDRLLQESADEVLLGALIVARILEAKKIIFAIEDNKPEAINALNKSIETANKQSEKQIDLSICVAPTKYPSGGEKQTIELVTGKQVPKGELPASLGLVVQNVATLHAVQNAVINAEPLIGRVVTLTGELIPNPGNYWLPFGVKIEDVVRFFNVDESRLKSVIIGGPMMGQVITDFRVPITKATNCLIFNPVQADDKDWVLNAKPHQECIRCSECQNACPADLLPQQLYWFSKSQQWEPLENQGLLDCIECGACAFVCPSEIPLVHYFRYGKSEIRENRTNQQKSEHAKERFEFREMRLARAKAERAAKHKKAAEARKKSAQSNDENDKKNAINEALERVKQKKAQQNSEVDSNTTQESPGSDT